MTPAELAKHNLKLRAQVEQLREALESVLVDYELCGYPSSMKSGVAQTWRENMQKARKALRDTK